MARQTDGSGSLFSTERLLDPDYVPDDRLVNREEQLANIEYAVTPMLFGRRPDDILLTGPRGTGKTTFARYAAQKEVQNATEQGVVANAASVDCRRSFTNAKATKAIARAVNDHDATGITIPDSGLSLAEYHDRLWQVLDDQYDAIIVILDHLDHLEATRLPAKLAESKEILSSCTVAVIGIVDRPAHDVALSDAIKHAITDQTYEFEPYDRAELRAILDARRDAFRDGVLEETAIERTVELASEPSGDARKAIALLQQAGRLAQSHGDAAVTPDHVDAVSDTVTSMTIRELLPGLHAHSRYVLQSLARLMVTHDVDAFRTTRIYEAYQTRCDELNETPRTLRRVQDFLEKHAKLGLTDREVHWGGRADGNFYEHRLTSDPDIVLRALDEVRNP